MRIAFDSNIFTMQKYGGVSRYIVRLGEELSLLGNEVKVFGWLHKNCHLRDSRLQSQLRYIDEFPPMTRRIAHHLSDLVANRQLRNWQPSLIHETFCHDRMVGSQKTPRVCTIHDLIHQKFPLYRGRLNRIPEYQQSTICRSDAVICVSESTKQDLSDCFNIEESKIWVVHHGFEHATEMPLLTEAEEVTFANLKSMPYLLYVGVRDGYKNFHGFLRALKASSAHQGIRVVAFGSGPLTPNELLWIREMGFKAGDILHSSGSDSLLQALFRYAEAFIYPSIYEGFGFPPLEAMAEDCPVISSNTSSMPEVIGDAAEYFDPHSVDSMAQAIDSVVGSSGRRSQLIEAGKLRLKAFSWSKCAAETLAVYQTIS